MCPSRHTHLRRPVSTVPLWWPNPQRRRARPAPARAMRAEVLKPSPKKPGSIGKAASPKANHCP
eukprot:7870937-Prorocentrum_lima.AAC.1